MKRKKIFIWIIAVSGILTFVGALLKIQGLSQIANPIMLFSTITFIGCLIGLISFEAKEAKVEEQ